MLSALRESSDGGVWNSWNRQPFLTTYKNGTPSQYPAWRDVSYNFVINNYHGLVPIDADDGTSWMQIHHNYLAGGLWGFKNFFGHDKIDHNNVHVFPTSDVVAIQSPYLAGHADQFLNNTVFIRDSNLTVMSGPGSVHPGVHYGCQAEVEQVTVTGSAIYSSTGLVKWGCKSNDGTGNSVAKLPSEEAMIETGRSLLW